MRIEIVAILVALVTLVLAGLDPLFRKDRILGLFMVGTWAAAMITGTVLAGSMGYSGMPEAITFGIGSTTISTLGRPALVMIDGILEFRTGKVKRSEIIRGRIAQVVFLAIVIYVAIVDTP